MRDSRMGLRFLHQASQLRAESALAEKTKSNHFVNRQIRAAGEMV